MTPDGSGRFWTTTLTTPISTVTVITVGAITTITRSVEGGPYINLLEGALCLAAPASRGLPERPPEAPPSQESGTALE